MCSDRVPCALRKQTVRQWWMKKKKNYSPISFYAATLSCLSDSCKCAFAPHMSSFVCRRFVKIFSILLFWQIKIIIILLWLLLSHSRMTFINIWTISRDRIHSTIGASAHAIYAYSFRWCVMPKWIHARAHNTMSLLFECIPWTLASLVTILDRSKSLAKVMK